MHSKKILLVLFSLVLLKPAPKHKIHTSQLPSIKISVAGKRMSQILEVFSVLQAYPRKITAKSPTLGTEALSAWTTPAINQNSPIAFLS